MTGYCLPAKTSRHVYDTSGIVARMAIHGTRTKYVHEFCRCIRCVKANRSYQRDRWRVKRALYLVGEAAKNRLRDEIARES